MIGPRAIIAADVYIVDGNHRFRDLDAHILDQGYDYRPITIGEEALVHNKVTIINDIGNGRSSARTQYYEVDPRRTALPPACPLVFSSTTAPPGEEPPGWQKASTRRSG